MNFTPQQLNIINSLESDLLYVKVHHAGTYYNTILSLCRIIRPITRFQAILCSLFQRVLRSFVSVLNILVKSLVSTMNSRKNSIQPSADSVSQLLVLQLTNTHKRGADNSSALHNSVFCSIDSDQVWLGNTRLS